MAWQQFLFVLPNPWTGIDTDGRTYAHPAGRSLHDPEVIPLAEHSLVGCHLASVEILQAARIITVKGVSVKSSPAIQRSRWRYDTEPVKVPNTRWYRDEIKLGHLIAATVETLCACGFKPDDFVAPELELARQRELAIAQALAENPDMPEVSEPLSAEEGAAEVPAQPAAPEPTTSTLTDSPGAPVTGSVELADGAPAEAPQAGSSEPAPAAVDQPDPEASSRPSRRR